MRVADVLTPITAAGGELAQSGLHLGRTLRAGDHAADLAAALAAGPGTLDGALTSIQVGAAGVEVSYLTAEPDPVGAA